AEETSVDAFLAERLEKSVRPPRAFAVRPIRRILERALSRDPITRLTAAELATALQARSSRPRGARALLLPAVLAACAAAAILVGTGALPSNQQAPGGSWASPAIDPANVLRARIARQDARAERLE